MPPHVVAKAAQRLGAREFDALHDLLLEAYFERNLDITREGNLRTLWEQAGLPADAFPDLEDPELTQEVFADHMEALENGAGGAPAVRLDGTFGVLMGAQPTAVYTRWMERVLERRGPTDEA